MPASQYRTPLLVPVDSTFEEYKKSLSKPAKKNLKTSYKRCSDYQWILVPYDSELTLQFMQLWESQLVFGKHPRWIFGVDHFDRLAKSGALVTALVVKGETAHGMHLIEVYGDYAYSQPPMYGKSDDIGTFMWFRMIEALCESDIKWFDLGGAFHGTWVDLLKDRSDPILKYKWRYVPQAVKDNPDSQEPWERLDCSCGAKQIVLHRRGCKWCG